MNRANWNLAIACKRAISFCVRWPCKFCKIINPASIIYSWIPSNPGGWKLKLWSEQSHDFTFHRHSSLCTAPMSNLYVQNGWWLHNTPTKSLCGNNRLFHSVRHWEATKRKTQSRKAAAAAERGASLNSLQQTAQTQSTAIKEPHWWEWPQMKLEERMCCVLVPSKAPFIHASQRKKERTPSAPRRALSRLAASRRRVSTLTD